MPILPRVASLWRSVFRRRERERELEGELRSYVDLLTDEKIRQGMAPEEALRAALLEVGGVEQVKEEVRDAWAGAWAHVLIRDLRLGLRLMARSPGFTFVAVTSLALGVGGTAAAFGVVDAALLRPLAYPAADRLYDVRVWWDDFPAPLSPADLLSLRAVERGVAEVGAFFLPEDGFSVRGREGPEVVQGAILTADLLRVLGVEPVLGRWLSADRDVPEVLIGEGLWRQRFGGRPDALGRTIELDGEARTVVGVMPEGFNVPGQRGGELWAKWEPESPTRRGPFFLGVVARLPAELEPATAQRRLTGLAAPVLRDRYEVTEPWQYRLRPLKDVVLGDVRPTLYLLLGAASLILLIGVLNFANLLLARGLTRKREFSVRAALGAGRGRLVTQLLVEATSIGLLSGVLSVGFAALVLGAVRRLAVDSVPRIDEVHLGATVVGFAVAVGVAAGLGAGVVPALRIPWSTLVSDLRDGGRGASPGRGQGRARRFLVAAMVALTVTVLASAILLVRSLRRLEATDPGFDAAGVMSFRLALPESSYPDSATGKTASFLDELEGRLRALPGAASVGFSNALPPDRLQFSNDYTLEGAPPKGAGSDLAEWLLTSSGYFDALRIPVLRGRVFQPSDRDGAPEVTVVNEAFVRRHFGDADPIGRRLKMGGPDSEAPWMTIVGVVKDVPYATGVWGGASPTVYAPLRQNLWHRSPFVVVRTAGEPAALLPALTRVVREVDPNLPLRDVATMQQRLQRSAAAPRLRSFLVTALAGVALTLAVTGIFGVVAYEVNQRRRETAVRRALGARAGQVVAAVVRYGMGLAGVGIALGLVGAVFAARALAGLLYGVGPSDPVALWVAVLTVALTAAAACLIPAATAAHVDPMVVLRDE